MAANHLVPLFPKANSIAAGGEGGGDDGPGRGGPIRNPVVLPSRKRIGVVVACDSCRRRKTRCDGHRPKCQRCQTSGEVCVYEFAADTVSRPSATKEKNRRLLHKNKELQELLDHLRNRSEEDVQSIVQRLRATDDPLALLDSIRQAELLIPKPTADVSEAEGAGEARSSAAHHLTYVHPGQSSTGFDMVRSPGTEPPTTYWVNQPEIGFMRPHARQISSKFDNPQYMFEEAWSNTRDKFADPTLSVRVASLDLPVSRWTSVPIDNDTLNHILLLFWTWDMIGNRVIDRTMFEEDMRNLDLESIHHDELRFCSPFLVNAILALSCFYTTNSATYLEPGNGATRGAAFVSEALRLLPLEDHGSSLPVAQGIVFLCIYEGEFGTIPRSMSYITGYCEHYANLHLSEKLRNSTRASDKRVRQAISWIDWGFYVFEWKAIVPLNRRKAIKKPLSPRLWEVESSSTTSDYWWFAYPVSALPQRSYKREIFAEECRLVEIIEDVMDFLIPLDENDTPANNPGTALKLYARLVEWKHSLPDVLQAHNAVLPVGLLLHAYVDDVIIFLLRPFDSFTKAEFGGIDAKQTSFAHANSLINTIWTFRALYTVRNEFWLTHLFLVCAFRVLYDLRDEPIRLDTFVKACQGLHELSERFNIAKDALSSLQQILREQNLQLPPFATTVLRNKIEGVRPGLMRYTVVPVGSDKDSALGGFRHLRLSDIIATQEEGVIVD